MKKFIIALLLFSSLSTLHAQVNWVSSTKLAKALALQNKKFIVMDFWAIWCGPCRVMDSKMWNTDNMNEFNDKFIFLKVDVDDNRQIAMDYNATTIPKVVIIDPAGEVLWEQVGFSNAESYFKVFRKMTNEALPDSDYADFISDKSNSLAALNIGIWHQKVASIIKDPISKRYLRLSNGYLNKALKTDNNSIKQDAEANLIVNDALSGRTKKALKKTEKMDDSELKNFLFAFCYKCEGQNDLMKTFLDKIKSEEFLARLQN